MDCLLDRLHSFIVRASQQQVSALAGFAAGLALLAMLGTLDRGLDRKLAAADADLARLSAPTIEEAEAALESISNLNALKASDLEKMKAAMVGLAQKQKKYYEERLALSEERRQLEKQLELLDTYLVIDSFTDKIKVMRGDQVVKDFPFESLSCWGDVLRGTTPKTPRAAQVTSKEFYAHPERGEVKIQDGKLAWTPPQIGDVSRSDALGRTVVFTNTPLILHAPPQKRPAHDSFPHCCLNMKAPMAKKVYDALYIGTRIIVH